MHKHPGADSAAAGLVANRALVSVRDASPTKLGYSTSLGYSAADVASLGDCFRARLPFPAACNERLLFFRETPPRGRAVNGAPPDRRGQRRRAERRAWLRRLSRVTARLEQTHEYQHSL